MFRDEDGFKVCGLGLSGCGFTEERGLVKGDLGKWKGCGGGAKVCQYQY